MSLSSSNSRFKMVLRFITMWENSVQINLQSKVHTWHHSKPLSLRIRSVIKLGKCFRQISTPTQSTELRNSCPSPWRSRFYLFSSHPNWRGGEQKPSLTFFEDFNQKEEQSYFPCALTRKLLFVSISKIEHPSLRGQKWVSLLKLYLSKHIDLVIEKEKKMVQGRDLT